MSRDTSLKRKRSEEFPESSICDLSGVKTNEEARQTDVKSETQFPNVIELSSDNGLPDDTDVHDHKKKNLSHPQAIEIESDSDTEDDEGVELLTSGDDYGTHTYVGSFHTKIVGIQYYRGRVTASESVLIRREPTNSYDRNALQALNVNGQQVGHLPANIAAGLAPWLDNRICLVEGSVKSKGQVYSIPLTVDVFAQQSVADRLHTALARAGIQLNDNKSSRKQDQIALGGAAAKASVINIEDLNASSTTTTAREAAALLDGLTVNVKDLESMRKAMQPSRIATKMLDYQLQGLQWMLEKENPKLPSGTQCSQMWRRVRNSSAYFNVASNYTTDTPPVLGRGGLLADDMGLGKTVQLLSLIVEVTSRTTTATTDRAKSRGDDEANATLVICPTGLMSNWIDQAVDHVKASHPLDVERYHGKSRSGRRHLAARELVVSTYGTLTAEYKTMLKSSIPPTEGLFSVNWKRVILDEAHRIRNAKSQASLAVHALTSPRRWALTGTPCVNSYNDLAALVRFVRWTGGLESPEIFNAKLTRKLLSPGEDVRNEAVRLVKTLMQDLALRRRKDLIFNGKKLIDLPKFTEYHHKLQFHSQAEKDTYEKLSRQAKGLLKANSQKPSQVLEILLRMRQACCAKSMISADRLAMLDKLSDLTIVEFTEENRLLLQNLLALATESGEDCPICLDALTSISKVPVVTYCKHVFCKECISASISSKESCPLCRAPLKLTQLLEMPNDQLGAAKDVDEDSFERGDTSTKIEGLMTILKALRAKDRTNKVVVFSQWTKLLNLIEFHLEDAKFDFCRIDGTMTLAARDASMRRLQIGTASVLLASLAVASVGLNLTAANTVILMDPWWSPAIEDQAVDRVYRLGQKREVSVYKMVIEDTVEEKVLEIQDRKRKMTATIGAGQSRAQQAQTRRADLEALLGG